MSPVEYIDTGSKHKGPSPGVALCLSGGGYRAMIFHLGALWRLYEAGRLEAADRISSVSGGSITAGALGLAWDQLSFDPGKVREDFVPMVVDPVRELARKTIDRKAILSGLFWFGTISEKVTKAYREFLFGDKTLQDLPEKPRFVINATNIQSGALWRFMRPYMRDYKVGEVKNPTITLAQAVAASSAFPPVLSPCRLDLDPSSFTPNSGTKLQRTPFTKRVVLSDGGVYDNLGLETAYKRYETVLVSDAGGQMQAEEKPKSDWAQHSYRVLNVIDNQVRSLRKQQLIDSYISGTRSGTYWGIRTDIDHYELADAMACPHKKTIVLADTPTRLKAMDDDLQQRLVNWGYAVCDAAIRKHWDDSIAPPAGFPYPESGV